ncbi:MAG: hypothetical protein QOG52_1225 [Frankiaceae bacterium]|jgi:hypothetical protein|nr:hypothetical protein [Frankiaceae bacterium]
MNATRVIVPMSRGLRDEFVPLERGVLRLTRRGRVLALLVVTILVCIAFSVGRVSSSQAATGEPVVQHTVLVTSGETLWSIAKREAPTRDPREVVDAIQRANHLTGVLQIGQTLVLPALS